MKSTNTIFLTEINREINKLNDDSIKIELQIADLQKDESAYISNLYANKEYYGLLVTKFEIALRKEKLQAIRDKKEYSYNRFIKPVYLNKIRQFSNFKRTAPRRLNHGTY